MIRINHFGWRLTHHHLVWELSCHTSLMTGKKDQSRTHPAVSQQVSRIIPCLRKKLWKFSLILRSSISTCLEDPFRCLRTTDLSHCCLAIPVLAASRLQPRWLYPSWYPSGYSNEISGGCFVRVALGSSWDGPDEVLGYWDCTCASGGRVWISMWTKRYEIAKPSKLTILRTLLTSAILGSSPPGNRRGYTLTLLVHLVVRCFCL